MPEREIAETGAPSIAMQQASARSSSTDPPARRGLLIVLLLIPCFLGFRLWFCTSRPLVADEAVYWSWSRHLAGGYLDHPSMVAFLIRASCSIFGQTELGARFFCPLMASGALLILLWLGWRLKMSRRELTWLGAIWLCSPLLAALGTIITPDTPSVFFSVCAMAVAAVLLQDESAHPGSAHAAWLWMLFGVFCGLAFWSKYTTVLLPFSVGLAMLTCAPGRRHLRTPWPWLCAIPAILLFLPVLWWNATHDWASFRYQLHHGLVGKQATTDPASGAAPLAELGKIAVGLGRYLGSELLVWTPVLFVIGIVVVFDFWRRFGRLGASDRLLLWMASVPLLFFAIAAAKAKGEANWPIFAYFPLSILTVRWMAEPWNPARVGWVRNGCVVALIGMLVLQMPEVISRVLPERLRKPAMARVGELTGWPQWARAIGDAAGGLPIVTEKHQDAAELAFYLPGQPDVWPVGDGSRKYAFEYFEPKPNFDAMPQVVFVGYHYQWFAGRHGLSFSRMQDIAVPLSTGGERPSRLIFLVRR